MSEEEEEDSNTINLSALTTTQVNHLNQTISLDRLVRFLVKHKILYKVNNNLWSVSAEKIKSRFPGAGQNRSISVIGTRMRLVWQAANTAIDSW